VKVKINWRTAIAFIAAIAIPATNVWMHYDTKNSVEKKTVESFAEAIDSVDKDMPYDQVPEMISDNMQILKDNIDAMQDENELLKGSLSTAQQESDDLQSENEQLKGSLTAAQQQIDDLQRENDQLKSSLLSIQEQSASDEANMEIIASDNRTSNTTPKALMSEVSPYETQGYTVITKGEYLSMGGIKYYGGFQLGTWDTSYAIFNLGAKYSQITGIVGHIDGSGNEDKTVTIFVDGTMKQTIDIAYQDLPQPFTINITGAKQLKIERDYGGTQTGFADIKIQ